MGIASELAKKLIMNVTASVERILLVEQAIDGVVMERSFVAKLNSKCYWEKVSVSYKFFRLIYFT